MEALKRYVDYHVVQHITGFSKQHCWKIIREAKTKYQKNYSPKGKVWADTLAKYLDCSTEYIIEVLEKTKKEAHDSELQS